MLIASRRAVAPPSSAGACLWLTAARRFVRAPVPACLPAPAPPLPAPQQHQPAQTPHGAKHAAPQQPGGADTATVTDQLSERPEPAAKKARTADAADAAAQAAPLGLTAFEAERAARIAANQARLAALELPQLAAGLAATAAARPKPATQKGISTKRSRTAEALPRRQSARKRGEQPDPTTAGGIAHEGAGGRVVLAAFIPERYGGSSSAGGGGGGGESAAAAPPPPGPLPFKSLNGDEGSDAAFLARLRSATAGVIGGEQRVDEADRPATGARLAQLSCAAADVAKLTKSGVSCLAFHPGSNSGSRPLIAAADKGGNVGLWDIDHPAPGADGGAGGDGVLLFQPHSDYVSSLKWLGPRGTALLTGSYDGLLRRLDVETGVWDLVAGVPSCDDGWSAGEATPDGVCVYVATSAGQLSIIDTRCAPGSSSSTRPLLVANRKVNTLQLHDDEVHLASSASDGSIAVWDVRQLASRSAAGGSSSKPQTVKAVAAASHQKSCQGVYWEPPQQGGGGAGGRRLLSVSFDDTLRVWTHDGSSLQQQVVMKHNNNTGRWVMPFRPAWSPDGDAVAVGDMRRGVQLFKASTGTSLGLLTAPDALTAIPSRLAIATTGSGGLMLAAATSSGRVHVFR